MSKHTPGPWTILRVNKDSGHITIHSLDKNEGGVVAQTSGVFLRDVEANAALIAAAPELLDCAQQALNVLMLNGLLPQYQDLANQINAALAKAKGET